MSKPKKETVIESIELINTITHVRFPFSYTVHTKLYGEEKHNECLKLVADNINKPAMDIYKLLNDKYPECIVSSCSFGETVFQVFDMN